MITDELLQTEFAVQRPVAGALIDAAGYAARYAASVSDPEGFWGEAGKRLDWIRPYGRVKNTSFDYHNVSIRWFEDGQLNVSANCIDRHLAARSGQTAILWQGDDPADVRKVSYAELHREVSRLANVLLSLGVGKGDRVVLYLPMIPEAAFAMLACARIGAVHSVVFAGFSADALASRIEDCGAQAPDHRRRGAARRAQDPAQGQCRQGAGAGSPACASWWCAAPAARCPGTRPATSGCTRRRQASRTIASRWRWARRTRSSSSTPPAPPASPRGCCTPRAAIWSTRR